MRKTRTTKRIMYALFFNCHRVMTKIPVPEHKSNKSITGSFHRDSVFLLLWSTPLPLVYLQGYAISNCFMTKYSLGRLQLFIVGRQSLLKSCQTIYSSLPCDSKLNPFIKFYFIGRLPKSRHIVERALFQCLNKIPKEAFLQNIAFVERIQRLENFFRVFSEYFEMLD